MDAVLSQGMIDSHLGLSRKCHHYITLMYDLDNSTVEAIAMDMSDAYVRSARENIDGADGRILDLSGASCSETGVGRNP